MSCQGNAIEKMKGTLISKDKRFSVGTQIKMIRQQKEMSVKDFAKAFGLIEYNVVSLEEGRAWPTRELLFEIQDSLNVKFDGVN